MTSPSVPKVIMDILTTFVKFDFMMFDLMINGKVYFLSPYKPC